MNVGERSAWGAQAPRVLAIAPSRSRTFEEGRSEAPQPAREERALPGEI
jgi:hypothetical protein